MNGDNQLSPGAKFRLALKQETPLQIMGTINAFCALLAERTGYRAIYLSGAGVANASYGLPDLGYTSLEDVLEEIKRIAQISALPLLVDGDTAWDNPQQSVSAFIAAGAAGIHIEDQVALKRCGHRLGKALVSVSEMQSRLQMAVAGRVDPEFVIMARTDALSVEGFDAAVARAQAYVEAGADMIFAEALTTLAEYKQFTQAVAVPVLANITEFGQTPLFTVAELKAVGVDMVLYPLSAFRAMNAAALHVYQTVREQGTQQNVLSSMQTRSALYEILDYETSERDIDVLLTGQSDEK